MSTRQNKKRKGRSNVMNRERTVTTLTEGPESSFLVPTPTEEPGGNVMSSPFSVASSAGAPNMSPAAFQMGPNNFGPFPYNGYIPPMPAPNFAPQHPPQQFFPSPPQGPPGQKDLEMLERLKETIKNGQHEFFRAVPQPATLATLYQGPKNFQSQVPPHPEQAPLDHQQPNVDVNMTPSDVPTGNGSANSSAGPTPELSRGLASQSSEARDSSRKSLNQPPMSDSESNLNTVMQSPISAALSIPYTGPKYEFNPGPMVSIFGKDSRDGNPSNHGTSSASKTQRVTHDMTDNHSEVHLPGSRRYEPQNISRTQSERSIINEPPTPEQKSSVLSPGKSSVYDGKDDLRPLRESSWSHRNGTDDKQRYDTERSGQVNGRPSTGNGNDSRGPGQSPRFFNRERDRDRDRDHDRDRDWERDKDRRPDYNRFRDDRRNDDRTRVPESRRQFTEQRHYESRWGDPVRRYESKPPGDSSTLSRMNSLDDRNPPPEARPRTLGEERAIIRPPLDASTKLASDDRRPTGPPAVDDRSVKPAEDRRPPLSSADRQARDVDDRRPPPSPTIPSDRSVRLPDDRRPPMPPPPLDRSGRPLTDDRRIPPPPPTNERLVRPPDDRRPPLASPVLVNRQVRSAEERRQTIPPSPTMGDRQVRSGDDRRVPLPPPSSADRDRQTRPPLDDRRLPLTSSIDRITRPNDDRRPPFPPASEDRTSRPTAVAPPDDSAASRPPFEDRSLRKQPNQDDVKSRPPVPLEDRISRPPVSLQERLGGNSRSDDRFNHPPRPDDRLSRPAPSLEERLSHAPPSADDRNPRPAAVEERLTRPTLPPSTAASASDRTARTGPDDRNMLLAEPARPPAGPPDRASRPDERGRPLISDRGAPPPSAAAAAGERGPPHRTLFSTQSQSRSQSLVRASPRGAFKPRSPTRSPARSEIREFRPPGEPPRDRAEIRPPYRHEQDRYTGDRRSDMMDVDPPSSRFSAPYRRPPSPVAADSVDPYASRPRPWTGEGYPDEAARRPPLEAHTYGRDWPQEDRTYAEEWDARSGRTWERPVREYERDRYVERDAVPNNGWETREERERRVSSTFPPPVDPPSAVPRPFEQRPLSSRLTDTFAAEEPRYGRDLERARYPPVDPASSSFSRVRARSPSPLRRSGGVDDLRPPVKRAREDGYVASGYYSPTPAVGEPPRAVPPGGDYPPRLRTPPVNSTSYYEGLRGPAAPPYATSQPAVPLPRERDYADSRDRAPPGPDVGGYQPYDRREPLPRMPPPRSPPPYNDRYSRDDRRFSVPPRSHAA